MPEIVKTRLVMRKEGMFMRPPVRFITVGAASSGATSSKSQGTTEKVPR